MTAGCDARRRSGSDGWAAAAAAACGILVRHGVLLACGDSSASQRRSKRFAAADMRMRRRVSRLRVADRTRVGVEAQRFLQCLLACLYMRCSVSCPIGVDVVVATSRRLRVGDGPPSELAGLTCCGTWIGVGRETRCGLALHSPLKHGVRTRSRATSWSRAPSDKSSVKKGASRSTEFTASGAFPYRKYGISGRLSSQRRM